MDLTTIYTTLVNAGFVVCVSGESFIVSLYRRRPEVREVEIALDWPTNIKCARTSNGVQITLK